MLIKRLTHLEDNVFGCAEEIDAAINVITALVEPRGYRDCRIEIKTDGAPAFIAGVDPEDDKFFVGTKGALTNPAKRYKSRHLVYNSGADKAVCDALMATFNALNKRATWFKETKMWLQGDILFANNTKDAAERFKFKQSGQVLSCQPNVIEYQFVHNDEKIEPKVGFVIHTAYQLVNGRPEYDASFVPDYHFGGPGVYHLSNNWPMQVPLLGQVPDVELTLLLAQISTARNLAFQRSQPIPVSVADAAIRTYNKFVKANRGGVVGAEEWFNTMVNDLWNKGVEHANGLVREHSKQSALAKLKTSLESIQEIKDTILNRMNAHRIIRRVKDTVLSCVPHAHGLKQMNAYLNGEMTLGEGLVVSMNRGMRIPVKLVDRSVFSYNNFALHGETTDGE